MEDQFKSTRKVAEQFAVATKGVEQATSAAGKAAERTWPKISKFASAIGRIAKYRLIRSIIRGITDAIKEGSDNFYKYSKDVGAPFADAMDNVKSAALTMKNQVGSAFGELFQAVVPIILDLIGYITQLASVLSMVWAALSGKGGWYKAKEGLDAVADSAGGAGSAAKEALKYLAPFDELNRLPSDNGSGGGGGGGNNGLSDMFDFQEWEEDSAWGKIAQYVRENLEAIELLVDIFGFSIGVAMLLSGHIGYGLGLMLYFGYKGVQAVSENWETIKTQMQGSIGKVTAIVSGALLVLGAVLAFSGASIPIGLGMMVAGAAGLATAAVANWSSIKTALEGPLGEVAAMVSAATLVLGILLLIAGAWPLGLGLIVAGAAGLGTAITLNWDSFIEKIREFIGHVNDEVELGVAWISDYIGRGGLQLIINAINGLLTPINNAVNGIIDDINSIVQDLIKTFPKFAEWLGIDESFHLDPIDLKLIPDLDPPVGTFYNQTKAEIEAKSKKSPVGVDSKANLKGYERAELKTPVIDSTANLTKSNSAKLGTPSINSTALFTKSMTGSEFSTTWDSTANWTKSTYKGGTKNYTWWTTWDSTANWTTSKYKGGTKDYTWWTTWDSTANYTKKTIAPDLKDSNGNMIIKSTAKIDKVDTSSAPRVKLNATAEVKARGGVFQNGGWKNIPQFAGGGSLFVAGEAGPEVVGHFNNRTEVLNQSQMASAIASGVAKTMAGIRFSLMGLPSSNNSGDMYDAMYSAMSRALAENADDRPIMLDGDVVYQNMVRKNRQEMFRSGVNPMMSMA